MFYKFGFQIGPLLLVNLASSTPKFQGSITIESYLKTHDRRSNSIKQRSKKMAANKLKTAFIKELEVAGKKVAFSYATQTDTFVRPLLAQNEQDDCAKALEKLSKTPEKATKVVLL